MITQWNDAEDEALQGLPLRAQIIYLRGLRRHMDYQTGIVGIKRKISLKSLSEVSQEVVNKQFKDAPTKNAIRASLEQLKKVGLIERIGDEDQLIFFLKMADVQRSVQNNHDTTTTQPRHRDSNTEETSNDAAFEHDHDTTTTHPKPANHNTHQITDKQILKDKKKLLDVGDKTRLRAASSKPFLPDWLNKEAWELFEQHRKSKRKSLTDLSRPLMIEKLNGLSADEQRQVIEYSIGAGYPDLYPDRIRQRSDKVISFRGNDANSKLQRSIEASMAFLEER